MIFHKRPVFHCRSIFFAIQDKEDDTQDDIDQDQPLLEQTLLMIKSTPSRDDRDIIVDVTLSSKNLAEVEKLKSKSVRFFRSVVSVAVLAFKTNFRR